VYAEARLGQRVERGAELELRAVSAEHLHARLALGAAAVERDEPVAAPQAQHVAEVVRLALVERQRCTGQFAVDE
jgi:hypothetical protein